jgi:signal transduction histidine kinase
MPEILKSIVTWVVELLQVDSSSIFLWNDHEMVLEHAISCGYAEQYTGLTVKPGEGMAGRVFESGQPMIIDDYHAWEGKLDIFTSVPPYDTTLGVPMQWQTRTIGVLVIDADSRHRALSKDDVRLCTLFANVATVAIENARLYEQLQERSEKLQHALEQEVAQRTSELAYRVLQLETSARVSREIASILNIDELLSRVVELVRDSFGYYHVHIYLLDPPAGRLLMRATTSTVKPQRARLSVGPGSLNGEVAQTNRALMINDISQEPRFLADEQLPNTRSELVVPLRVGERVVGTLDVQSELANAFREDDGVVIQSLGDQVAMAIENARLYEHDRELAVLKERHRLARELHDSVTQSLFSIDLHATAIAASLKRDPRRAEEQIEELRQITFETLQEMRSLILALRPAELESAGLAPALRQQIARLRQPDGPEITIHIEGERRLSLDVEQGLYRIAQEAIRNAVKHAGARRIETQLVMADSRVTLRVEDDGCGFDIACLPANHRTFGLIGMKERAELMDGQLDILSQPGQGTRVEVRVSVQAGSEPT